MDVWYSGDYGISFYEYGDEENPIGDFIGHTWKNWSLIPTVRPFVVPPTRKKSELEVKGIHGKIDTSRRLTGYPLFNNREGSWTFYVADLNDYSEHILDSQLSDIQDNNSEPLLSTTVQGFSEKYSQLLNLLQGREVAIVLDEDPDYFYRGSIDISEWVASNDGSLNGFTLTYDLFPFKIEKEQTIIDIDLSDIDGNLPINDYSVWTDLPCGTMPVIPYFKMDSSYVKLYFINEETGLEIQSLDTWNTTYSSNRSWQKLYYYYPKNRPTILLTNTFNKNTCRVKIVKNNDVKPTWVKFMYRKGWA